MPDDTAHAADLAPYSFEVFSLSGTATAFGFLIRRDGTVYQRSDRPYPSEAEARRRALDQVEKLRARPD